MTVALRSDDRWLAAEPIALAIRTIVTRRDEQPEVMGC
jgi:hypothetical protein